MTPSRITRRGLLAAPALLLPRRGAAATPPNILFILTDDQARWTLGSYGNTESHTPNMDRIGREGAVFDRCFVTTPVCSPSRSSLITSQYSFRTCIYDFLDPSRQPETGLSTRFPTWPRELQKAGYSTGLIGKWHLGVKPEFHPTRHGYGYFYGFRGGGNTASDPLIERDGVERIEKGLTADLTAEGAIDFLRRPRSGPFALSVHFREPHGPHLPVSPAEDALFEGKTIGTAGYKGPSPERVRKERLTYYKSIASADRNIGRILDELDRQGLASNTAVIFSSDNGFLIGQHGLRQKGNATYVDNDHGQRRPNMFDESVMVPFTMRWPGVIRPGTRIREMISFLDYFPTILSITGAGRSLPADYTPCGLDFSPLLRGEKIPWRSAIFGDYRMINYFTDTMRMIRTDDWKMVTHSHTDFGFELYDLREDPHEENNTAKKPAYTDRALAMLERLRSWQRWTGDPELPAA